MTLAYTILAAGPSDRGGGGAAKLPVLTGLADATLLDRLHSSDDLLAERSFDELYRAYYARLVAVARPYAGLAGAEEIVQDVMTQVWVRRHAIEPKGTLGVYLYTAVRNAAISRNRHERVVGRVEHAALAEGDVVAMGTHHVPADADAEYKELVASVSAGLQRLSEGMRTAFTLRWIHELSYPEVAQIMGIAEPAARKQVSRAREALLPILRAFVHD